MPIIGLEDEIRREAARILTDAANAVMADLMEAAPEGESGELKASARGPEVDEVTLTATVAFDSMHADWTDQGVDAHGIDGNPLMVFYWDPPRGPMTSGIHAFSHVDHPGQAAQHWFSDITDNWEQYVQDVS